MSELSTFIRESNRIEGITRPPLPREIKAHEELLALETLDIDAIKAFVAKIAPGKHLREHEGMDVRVGNHFPPQGGPFIPINLMLILSDASKGKHPYAIHLAYETLHPFMDGNGRSGRAIWLWQMIRQMHDPWVLKMGFLHKFYYQALAASSER